MIIFKSNKIKIGMVCLLVLLFILIYGATQTPRRPVIDIVSNDLKSISGALMMFRLANSVYPSTEEGLKILVKEEDPGKYRNWRQYLVSYPVDVWSNPYQYQNLDGDIDIYSFGPDGIKSGDDIWWSEVSQLKGLHNSLKK